jgi:DNA invertase Pin-like site-specific DNA recombinase
MSSHHSTKAPADARVYSYVRFSTPEQAMGDSERRQLQEAQHWAQRTGRRLDESLTPDRGLSARTGAHRTKGSLGKFLRRVKDGLIAPGSTLLVENLDRLGREGPSKTLRETIFALWDHGITLQTLRPEEAFPPGCDSDPRFVVLILYLQRAWDDSQRKSDLAKSNWAEKHKLARTVRHTVTGSVPAWVEVEYDHADPQHPKAVGRKLIPAAAATIRNIFDWRLQGLGYGTIERRLNAEAAWVPPLKKGGGRLRQDGAPAARQLTRGWRISYVKKILVNRAVLGEYQPHVDTDRGRLPVGEPIADYFPRLIEPEVFHAVQALLAANRGKGGRTARARNLLAHLARCGYCGGPMAFSDRAAKGGQWLICDNGRRGVKDDHTGLPLCRRHSMKYAECEQLLLDGCHGLKPEQVLPDADAHARLCQSLRQRLQGKQAELDDTQRRTGNLIDQIADSDDKAVRCHLEGKLKELNDRRQALTAEKDAAAAALAKAEGAVQSLAAWQRHFQALKIALKGGDVALREKMRSHLRELVDRVEVYATGGQHYQRVCIDRTDTIDGTGTAEPLYHFDCTHSLPQSEAEPFVAHVNGRLATREGRFVRVYFKSLRLDWGNGSPRWLTTDLVPEGSLAEGFRLAYPQRDVVDAFVPTAPTFTELWQEYQESQCTGKPAQPARKPRRQG